MTNWKRLILTAAAITAAVYFWVSYNPDAIPEGGMAPDFTLSTQAGQPVQLSKLRGKLVLIHFWATWCSTCTYEMPKFNAMAKSFKDESDLVILGVSLDDTGRGRGWTAIEAFEKQAPLNFMVLMDKKGATADAYGTHALPETYLIGRDGKILQKFIGAEAWDSPKMQSYLKSEISKNPN